MKIALDISPVSKNSTSAHRVRGVGAYINLLIDNLPKFDKKNEYVFIEDKQFPKDADLVHYPYFDPFFITLPIHSSKKFVVTVHDLTPIVFKNHFPVGVKGELKWKLQKKLLGGANMIFADSNASREDIIKIVGTKENKVRTIYLAAGEEYKREDQKRSAPIMEKYSLPDNFLLYVGDATWNKNLPRLVEAVKRTKHTLVLVGKVWGGMLSDISNNAWNNDLKEAYKQMEGNKQFIRLGFVADSDLVKIYNAAGALIMPSLYEGFGLPALEAMSCAVPVIVSKEGSLGEVAGDAGFYIDPIDSENIAWGINAVLDDPKLQSELSKRGYKQSKEFTTKKTIENTVNAYIEAINVTL